MDNWLHKNDNVEQLLQNEAEKYRVYPSDKVWSNIREEMHGKTRWSALTFVFSAIVLALTIATIYNYPPQKFILRNNPTILSKSTMADSSSNTSKIVVRRNFVDKAIFVSTPTHIAFANTPISFYVKKAEVKDIVPNNVDKTEQVDLTEFVAMNLKNKVNTKTETNTENTDGQVSLNIIKPNKSYKIFENNSKLQKCNDANSYLNNLKIKPSSKQKKQSSWTVQYYATASNSYRTLNDDKDRLPYITNAAEKQALQKNVNDVVKQKPAVGGEFGVSFLRKLSKSFYLKAGVQFNVRQYGIDAFKSNGNATFSYVQNNQLNTFFVNSGYSTQEGTAATKLQNQLYQFSVPIGVQWDFVDGERWGLSAAATIQPTLTLNKSVYVISTDYKYYVDGTSFFRRLNVNTSTEVLLTLKSKNFKWFFGPQIRYQQMPTYNDLYPIKEHRIDYGIKVGFVKSL